jgi:hypothetical protein
VRTNFVTVKLVASPEEFSSRAAGLIAYRKRSIRLRTLVFRQDGFDVIDWEGTEFWDVRP